MRFTRGLIKTSKGSNFPTFSKAGFVGMAILGFVLLTSSVDFTFAHAQQYSPMDLNITTAKQKMNSNYFSDSSATTTPAATTQNPTPADPQTTPPPSDSATLQQTPTPVQAPSDSSLLPSDNTTQNLSQAQQPKTTTSKQVSLNLPLTAPNLPTVEQIVSDISVPLLNVWGPTPVSSPYAYDGLSKKATDLLLSGAVLLAIIGLGTLLNPDTEEARPAKINLGSAFKPHQLSK